MWSGRATLRRFAEHVMALDTHTHTHARGGTRCTTCETRNPESVLHQDGKTPTCTGRDDVAARTQQTRRFVARVCLLFTYLFIF